MIAAGQQRLYASWINELEEHVIESLANQAELPIILASHLGERVGPRSVPNGLRQLAHKNLGRSPSWRRRRPGGRITSRRPGCLSRLNIWRKACGASSGGK